MSVVLVTGAAGGLGSAVCERFAAGGWDVIATDRPDARAAIGDWIPADLLDVEQILRDVMPQEVKEEVPSTAPKLRLEPGQIILAADDSAVARMMIEKGLKGMDVPYIMTKTGKEAWEKLQSLNAQATDEGKSIKDKVALVLTDLEMPEMDGFTLTRNIKQDGRFSSLPVIIHSSLTGATNESHVKSVGADAYIAKFVEEELAATIREVLHR